MDILPADEGPANAKKARGCQRGEQNAHFDQTPLRRVPIPNMTKSATNPHSSPLPRGERLGAVGGGVVLLRLRLVGHDLEYRGEVGDVVPAAVREIDDRSATATLSGTKLIKLKCGPKS